MPKVNLALTGFYESETLEKFEQECVNWYQQISKSEGDVSLISLRGSAGIAEKLTTGVIKQINRGAHVKAGKAYFLNGETLVRVDITFTDGVPSFAAESLGTIPGEGRVSMADNGTQLMVLVTGGDGFIIDEAQATPMDRCKVITDVRFKANGARQHVRFNSTYFVVTTEI